MYETLQRSFPDLEPWHEFHHRVREGFGLACDRECREPKSRNGVSFIAELKSVYRVEDVAVRLTRLRGSGNSLRGKCPFHNERNGEAFIVWIEHQKWRCFGQCATGGDVIDLVDVAMSKGLLA